MSYSIPLSPSILLNTHTYYLKEGVKGWMDDRGAREGEDWWYDVPGGTISSPVMLVFRDRRTAILFLLTFCQYDFI
jgi:hypothetical protein